VLERRDEREQDDTKLQRKYTFVVAPNANKIQIKQAVEAIYNAGKKKDEAISVVAVNTMNVRGKARRNTERFAQDRGLSLITIETLYDAKAHFSR